MNRYNRRNKFLKDSTLYLLVAIFAMAVIVIGFGIKVYVNQYEKTMTKLELEGDRIERTFISNLDYTAEIMKLINAQIALHSNDLYYINNILNKYRANPYVSNIVSWTMFSWINNTHELTVDGERGIYNSRVDVSSRDYLQDTEKEPNKLFLGKVVLGASSKRQVIPAGMGMADNNGRYLGTLTVGFDIGIINDKLKDSIKTYGVNFTVFDREFQPIFRSSDDGINKESFEEILKENYYLGNYNKYYSKIRKFIYGNNYYFYKFNKYPYIICLYYNKKLINQWLWRELTSSTLEISIVVTISYSILIFIYRREVSFRREAEQAQEIAIAASQAKSDFLAYTAHEIKTPLSYIITGAEIMHSQLFGEMPAKYLEYVKNIQQGGNDLLEFIDELLDEMRTERGQFKINNKVVLIDEVLSKVIKQNNSKAVKNKITLVNNSEEKFLPKLITDPRRLVQILNNLIINAIKYSPENSEVRIGANLVNKNIVITVEDQGYGFEESEIEMAFNKYETIYNYNSKKVDSLGLGLPLVKILVDALNAQIIVDSKKNIGTIFKVIFPAARIYYEDK